MEKIEEVIAKHTNDVLSKLNSCSVLPFIGKNQALMMFVNLSNAVTEIYRKGEDENKQKLLCRLAELDKLYEEREQERLESFVKLMCEMKNEMMKASHLAFCNGVCKHSSSISNTLLCYCARRQRFLKSLEESLDKYIQDNKEKLTTKYNEVSWKKEK